jgi:hypothetical protein
MWWSRKECPLSREEYAMGLDIAEMVMDVEDEFQIQFPDDNPIHTVGELRDFVVAQLKQRGPVDEQAVWLKVVEIIKPWTRSTILPESHFVKDLGMG